MEDCHIKFDFLGKDSIRYENEVQVHPRVHELVREFCRKDSKGNRERPTRLCCFTCTHRLNATGALPCMPAPVCACDRTAGACMSAQRPCVIVGRTHCRSAIGPLCVHVTGQQGQLRAVLLACDAARAPLLPVARPDVWVPAWQCLHPFACSQESPAVASLGHCEAVLRLLFQQPKP